MSTTKNRLKLDFTLKTNLERSQFVNKYLSQEMFTKRSPTEAELETIANYILWGKDYKTGLNSKQSKEIQLETRNKTWDSNTEESLDALLEMPGFTESMIRAPQDPVLRIPREVFSREEARLKAPPHILEKLEELWLQIDEIDLIINFYDLAHNKRKNPPRENLLERFSLSRQKELEEKALNLNQYHYLKLRHLLVELRREQFTLRDSYSEQVASLVPTPIINEFAPTLQFDTEINVAPLGLKYEDQISQKLFPKNRFPNPEDFTEEEINSIIKKYWQKKEQPTNSKYFIDFREVEHIYNIFLLMDKFNESYATKDENIFSTFNYFIATLKWYIARARLSEIHQDILYLKLRHKLNQKIADYINKKYNKTYNANYISTIFRQKIIPQINETARYHEEIILNLPFPENFKKCRTCGEILLIGTDNFVRKARSTDGFSTQCKRCDKKKRDARKETT